MFLLQMFIPGTEKSVEKIFSVNNTYHNGGWHFELNDRTPLMCVA